MSAYERFEHFEQKVKKASDKANGVYLSQLSASDLSLLNEWYEVDCKPNLTEATSRSYKSYVAKAIAQPEVELTNDQSSAMRRFLAWLKTKG